MARQILILGTNQFLARKVTNHTALTLADVVERPTAQEILIPVARPRLSKGREILIPKITTSYDTEVMIAQRGERRQGSDWLGRDGVWLAGVLVCI